MRRDDFNRFCRSLPHTSHVAQWGGADVWKVGEEGKAKVFAIGMADGGSGDWFAVSFKCSRMSFDVLMDAPGFRPAPLSRLARHDLASAHIAGKHG